MKLVTTIGTTYPSKASRPMLKRMETIFKSFPIFGLVISSDEDKTSALATTVSQEIKQMIRGN